MYRADGCAGARTAVPVPGASRAGALTAPAKHEGAPQRFGINRSVNVPSNASAAPATVSDNVG